MSLNFGFLSTGGSGSALFSLPIQNTLYVAKNGDDSTGLPNRLDKPFLTIFAASQVATAGDAVYVFAGLYDEGFSDWVKSDVIYDFQDGSLVRNFWRCVSDYGIQKNVRIEGSAVFQVIATNFSFGVIDFQNTQSKLYLRCKDIIGITNGVSLNNMQNPYDVKFRKVSTTNQYPLNLRGSANTGRIEFDTIESLSSTVPILLRNCNTDGNRRNIFIKGRRLVSGVNAFSQATITFINVLNTSLYCEIDSIEHISGASGGIFAADSGYCFMYNSNATGVGYGYLANGSHRSQIQNCNVSAPTYSITVQSNSSVTAKNTLFIGNNAAIGASATFTQNANFVGKNCVFVQRGADINSFVVNLSTPANRISFASCLFIANSLNAESFKNSNNAPTSVFIQEDCSSNKPVSALITNQVAGTNIVVDSDIVQNTTNFF
jgi:hypothetical protein